MSKVHSLQQIDEVVRNLDYGMALLFGTLSDIVAGVAEETFWRSTAAKKATAQTRKRKTGRKVH